MNCTEHYIVEYANYAPSDCDCEACLIPSDSMTKEEALEAISNHFDLGPSNIIDNRTVRARQFDSLNEANTFANDIFDNGVDRYLAYLRISKIKVETEVLKQFK